MRKNKTKLLVGKQKKKSQNFQCCSFGFSSSLIRQMLIIKHVRCYIQCEFHTLSRVVILPLLLIATSVVERFIAQLMTSMLYTCSIPKKNVPRGLYVHVIYITHLVSIPACVNIGQDPYTSRQNFLPHCNPKLFCRDF